MRITFGLLGLFSLTLTAASLDSPSSPLPSLGKTLPLLATQSSFTSDMSLATPSALRDPSIVLPTPASLASSVSTFTMAATPSPAAEASSDPMGASHSGIKAPEEAIEKAAPPKSVVVQMRRTRKDPAEDEDHEYAFARTEVLPATGGFVRAEKADRGHAFARTEVLPATGVCVRAEDLFALLSKPTAWTVAPPSSAAKDLLAPMGTLERTSSTGSNGSKGKKRLREEVDTVDAKDAPEFLASKMRLVESAEGLKPTLASEPTRRRVVKSPTRRRKLTSAVIAKLPAQKPDHAIMVKQLMDSLGGMNEEQAAENIGNLYEYITGKKVEESKKEAAYSILGNFSYDPLPAFSNYSPHQVIAGLWARAEQFPAEESSSSVVVVAAAVPVAVAAKKSSPKEGIFSILTKEIEPIAMLQEMLQVISPGANIIINTVDEHPLIDIKAFKLDKDQKAILATLLRKPLKAGGAIQSLRTLDWDDLTQLLQGLGFTPQKDNSFEKPPSSFSLHRPHGGDNTTLYNKLVYILFEKLTLFGFTPENLAMLLADDTKIKK